MYKHDVKCIKVLCGFRTVQASGVPRIFFGGVQQIQLRTEDRDLEALAP